MLLHDILHTLVDHHYDDKKSAWLKLEVTAGADMVTVRLLRVITIKLNDTWQPAIEAVLRGPIDIEDESAMLELLAYVQKEVMKC